MIGKAVVFRSFLKSKLTEKCDNAFLFVTVEQYRPIIINTLASLESQPVSNFVDKAIILKKLQKKKAAKVA